MDRKLLERVAGYPRWAADLIESLEAKLERAENEREHYRDALVNLAAQSSGVPTSTTRSDCMAALAKAALVYRPAVEPSATPPEPTA